MLVARKHLYPVNEKHILRLRKINITIYYNFHLSKKKGGKLFLLPVHDAQRTYFTSLLCKSVYHKTVIYSTYLSPALNLQTFRLTTLLNAPVIFSQRLSGIRASNQNDTEWRANVSNVVSILKSSSNRADSES